MRKIPSTMVSQHPDHANTPYWHNDAYIPTQWESYECFLSFSDLGVDEYKWDWEGKLVDESVIDRLLSQHYDFFEKHPLGKEKFLTFRLPNPQVQTEFRVGRALMNIMSASAFAQQAGLPASPIFEAILPMTETAKDIIEIQEAFHELSNLKHKLFRLGKNSLKNIEMIPLFEEVFTLMRSHKILEEYLERHQKEFGYLPSYMRPYIARSDPALNAGLIPTVLAIKVTLSNYQKLAEEKGIPMYPIIGSASLPFRGGLTPTAVERFIDEYHGVRTALLQSAFRYDYAKEDVLSAIRKLDKELAQNVARPVSEAEIKRVKKIIPLFEKPYKETIEGIADSINFIASRLPKRRERVQHIGLFGYSRGVGKVKLPRAIGFTAALYSLGIPPEIIGTGRGLKALGSPKDMELIEKLYRNLRYDLRRAGRYLNKENLAVLAEENSAWKAVQEDITEIEKFLREELGPQTTAEKQHAVLASQLLPKLKQDRSLQEHLQNMAILRQSMG